MSAVDDVLKKYKDQLDLYRAGLDEHNARMLFSMAMLSDVTERWQSVTVIFNNDLNKAQLVHAVKHLRDMDTTLNDAKALIGSVVGKKRLLLDVPGKIEARAWSDDQRIIVDFNAAPWFYMAKPNEVVKLAESGWSRSEPADQVALGMKKFNDKIDFLFKYIERVDRHVVHGDTVGFEVEVNEEQAMAWMKEHHPHMLKVVKKALKE